MFCAALQSEAKFVRQGRSRVKMKLSVGQQLQNWLIRNDIDNINPLFVSAVDLTVKNEIRRRGYKDFMFP